MIRNFVETSEPDRRLFERDPALLDCFTDSLIEAIDRSHTGIVAELNFYAAETPAETSGLARPLLVWHGLEDEMNSIADVKRMLDGAPVEAFHVVEGQGHMVLFTNFKEVLSRLVHEPH
jgi:pimeloyl-ACP methyl ester carboxylesterase